MAPSRSILVLLMFALLMITTPTESSRYKRYFHELLKDSVANNKGRRDDSGMGAGKVPGSELKTTPRCKLVFSMYSKVCGVKPPQPVVKRDTIQSKCASIRALYNKMCDPAALAAANEAISGEQQFFANLNESIARLKEVEGGLNGTKASKESETDKEETKGESESEEGGEGEEP